MSIKERIISTVSNLEASNNSLLPDIRNTLVTLKIIAESLERENRSDLVKQLDAATLELIPASDDITRLNSALHTIANDYNSSEKLTDFKKLIEDHISNLKADSDSTPESHVIYKQFQEAVWRVHHAGQPMPGEEQEEVILTSTQGNLVNMTCPLTGKPITELDDPVRSIECKHIYEKEAVLQHLKKNGKKKECKCASAGCPKLLTANKLVCDNLLKLEIEELRMRGSCSLQAEMVANCTEIEED
eukprot:TRINITY_DN24033_c0_g1_i1.p1 TRINITY_DN24033_c0_g1~~TRINITY_DN24033_c0_g1_i1.p1  ORF type:complete len:245 (+),score=60.74 TRINITY_DN24033_c0_g1_i1:239-973(+)